MALTQAFIPEFRKRGEGTIAFNGSILGFTKIAGTSPYMAVKYAIAGLSPVTNTSLSLIHHRTGFAESLALELESFNIRVICLEPGSFRTPLVRESIIRNVPV